MSPRGAAQEEAFYAQPEEAAEAAAGGSGRVSGTGNDGEAAAISPQPSIPVVEGSVLEGDPEASQAGEEGVAADEGAGYGEDGDE